MFVNLNIAQLVFDGINNHEVYGLNTSLLNFFLIYIYEC